MKGSLFSKLKNSLTGSEHHKARKNHHMADSRNFRSKHESVKEDIFLTDSIIRNEGQQIKSEYEFDWIQDLNDITFSKKSPQKGNFRKMRQKIYCEKPRSVETIRSLATEKKMGSNNFYTYYKNELIKLRNENCQLLNKIDQLQNLVGLKSIDIRKLTHEIETLTDEVENRRKQQKQLKITLENKEKQILQQKNMLKTKQQLKQNEILQIQNKEPYKQKKKTEDFLTFFSKYEEKYQEYLKIKDQNFDIRNKYAELKIKYAQICEKTYKFTPPIEHLWEIKNIQFDKLCKRLKEISHQNK